MDYSDNRKPHNATPEQHIELGNKYLIGMAYPGRTPEQILVRAAQATANFAAAAAKAQVATAKAQEAMLKFMEAFNAPLPEQDEKKEV